MASVPNPLQSAQAAQLVARLAKSGPTAAGGGPGGGMGGPAPEDVTAQELTKQFGELQGADPGFMKKTAEQIKGMLVAMYARAAFTIPDAARDFAQAQKHVDAAIKTLEKAAATQNTVRPPIMNKAALPFAGAAAPEMSEGAGMGAGLGMGLEI